MNKSSLLLILMTLVISCGKGAGTQNSSGLITGNIIGGVDVDAPNIYSKNTVGIFNAKENTVCSGVVIEDNLILTAAHCVDKTPSEKVDVSFANNVFDKNGKKLKAYKIIVNEKYNDQTIANDVALIRLSTNVPAPYSAVDLEMSRSLNLAKGDIVTAIGYGVNGTGFFSANTRGVLRMGELPIDLYDNSANHVIMNQSTGVAICFGDSGGPTFTLVDGRPVLVGISSFVNSEKSGRKNICKARSYLSNPNYFYSWIQESKLKI